MNCIFDGFYLMVWLWFFIIKNVSFVLNVIRFVCNRLFLWFNNVKVDYIWLIVFVFYIRLEFLYLKFEVIFVDYIVMLVF